MNKPIVSVVLPFRNAEDTLGEAIGSIRTQTFTDLELVLFDDGSEDESYALAEAAEQQDPRIRVMRSQHVGIVAALQQACRAASGAFIARMDADDVAAPQRLAKQYQLMDANPQAGLCGAQVSITGERVGSGLRRYEAWINSLTSHEAMVRDLFVECPVPHPTFMMRRDAYEAVGGYQDHQWAEDYDLCMRLVQAGYHLAKVDEPLLEWRHSSGRLSMNAPRYSPEAFRTLKRHYLLKSHLRNYGTFHQWGAGEVGKLWLREWGKRPPEAVVDINPRKIGRSIHGVPVIAPAELPKPGETFTVVAVGAPGAREEIRDWFGPRNYVETEDYVFLA